MEDNRKEFTTQLGRGLIKMLQNAPISQVSSEIKDKSKEYFSTYRTLTEAYDYLDSISKMPANEVNQFVKNNYGISKFYKRPELKSK